MDNYSGGIHGPKKANKGKDKSPYDRREEEVTKKAFKSVEKSVKPVAKDTNKTRRKENMKRREGPTVPKVKPHSSLKKDMRKPLMDKKPGTKTIRKM